jgi:hypothetical protein
VSSKSHFEPIQDGGKLGKAEKKQIVFVITSADPAVAF